MPRYGFNFQWMFSYRGNPPKPADEKALDFLAQHGLDFVRIPTDYRFWTTDFEYTQPDEEVLKIIDGYLRACRQRGIHMSLNLHRAPGYCINRCQLERDNLWTDRVAQDAFVWLWRMFAERYRDVPADELSFDLLNEPPHPGLRGMTRKNHANIMRRAIAAIREVDPHREIVLDGISGGNAAIPELADTGTTHSTRGYMPASLSHYKAPWAEAWIGNPDPPTWPGAKWDRKRWSRDTLEEFYRPWRKVEEKGTPIHIGEFGCYRRTPNDVALAWLADLFGVFRGYGWGYALWNFEGPFGIINHGRSGARVERIDGYEVDRDLLDLFLDHRVKE
ncbi:MAG: glycoside hydrolase family 5 protein [Phycisphaerae bacterium]